MGSKTSRNTSIEALRLVAVAGIAIFHTFQWTFQAVCTGLPEYAPLAAFPYSGALGFINLLGCWANEVFFMISGYFLIPSAVRALQNGSSAQYLTRKSFARLKKIVLPTLFYCAACLLVSMYVYPLPEISLHEIGWLTLGIEFIWVYAASVLLVPVIALIRQRIGSKRAPSSRRHFARNPYEPLPRAFPAPRGYRAQSRSRRHQGPYERLSDLLTPQTTKRAYTRNK